MSDPVAAQGKRQVSGQRRLTAEQRTARQLKKLQRLQQDIEELLVLSTTQHCLHASGDAEVAGQQSLDNEVQKLMSEIGSLVQPNQNNGSESINDTKCLTRHRTGTSRIQLRLSKPLVRILKAFAKAQRRPSVVVEKTMWKDAQIRDAAAILGISPPPPRRKASAK